MAISKILFLVAFIASINIVYSETQKDIKVIKQNCRKSVTITDEECELLMEKKVPTTKDGKCFLACIFKELGTMNADGQMTEEGAHIFAELKYADNVEKKFALINVAKICQKVNDVEVSDGKEGCERAGLSLECMLKENSAIVHGLK